MWIHGRACIRLSKKLNTRRPSTRDPAFGCPPDGGCDSICPPLTLVNAFIAGTEKVRADMHAIKIVPIAVAIVVFLRIIHW